MTRLLLSGFLAAGLLALVTPAASAQPLTAADSSGIHAAALDYAMGWYAGDAGRMARALHPALAKRIVHDGDSLSVLQEMDFDALVDAAGQGYGTRTPPAERRADVRIHDAFGNAAVVRLDMRDWVDFLHLARWNGTWKIVNVIWALREAPPQP